MTDNLAYALGFIFGICLFSAIIIIPMLIAITKDGKLKRKYDERQELIRGRGFKVACYTMIVLNIVYAIAMVVYSKLPIEPSAVMFIIAILGAMVYAWYCILNDGYFALNERVPQTIIVFTIIGLANLMMGISHILSENMIKNGVIKFECMSVVCGVLMLITVLVILIKQHKDKKED